MSLFRSKRGVVTLAVVVVLALFLVRPGANHLKARIVNSISLTLGRPVEVAAVKLRLLPTPGFDLENFVVHDDPAFGAEAMLRASEVTASLRITSLLRGRIEIARLSLTEPSLNLVRNPAGHWNLENLIERTAQISVAPTSKSKTERRPGFPYIEADRGRINFKFGPEKKPYALTEADFALWQDSENAWGVRLKARPVRTDFNLSDTGTLTVDGSWLRAATLRNTPLQFTLQWDRAQLGQVTKLTYGNDKGWRGGIKISTTLTGTPADLAIVAAASVQDFRRYDIFGGGDLKLAAHCNGRYSSVDHTLSEVACSGPVGDGAVTIAGIVHGPFSSPNYDLALTARDLPIQSLIALARHAKQGLPDDLIAAGRVNGNVKFRRAADIRASDAAWEGSGETSGFEFGSKLNKTESVLGSVPFAVSSAIGPKLRVSAREHVDSPSGPRLDVGPFNLALGRPVPATVRGWASRSAYSFVVQGDAQVQHLLQLARMVGIPAPHIAAEGMAKIDLQVAGGWSGFVPPKAVGKVQLHSIHAEVRGLNAPVEIASANVLLAPEQIEVQNLTASIADTSWRGSLALPRPCSNSDSCPVRFDLHTDEISTDRLNQLMNPHVHKQPWYRFLSSPPTGVPFLLTVRATGKLTANSVLVHKLVGNRVSANVELNKGKLRLSNLRGDVLGGRHIGEWEADFTAKPPEYAGSGTLSGIALNQLSKSMNDDWITGSATAAYRVKTSGLDATELFASATSTLKVEARDGILGHVALPGGTGPLQMHRFAAHLSLQDGKFEIQEGNLETPTGSYQVSGTASLTRILDLKLMHEGNSGFSITGTLTEPHVSPTLPSETQAALKP
ncbi:MAG TPA: AsmA family protein [Terriglobales bacterium]|nr:AsmA family protein [Terriglobales bacterium]